MGFSLRQARLENDPDSVLHGDIHDPGYWHGPRCIAASSDGSCPAPAATDGLCGFHHDLIVVRRGKTRSHALELERRRRR